jgi:hypothetical protein
MTRSGQNPRKLFKAYEDCFDSSVAKRCAGVLPPRPLRGRWGAVTATSRHILKSSRQELTAALKKAFSGGKDGGAGDDTHVGPRDVGELDNTIESNKEKLGRWTTETLKNIESDEFWGKLQLGEITRQPLVHLQHWLQKNHDKDPNKKLPKVVDFVANKANEIMQQFEILLDESCGDVWQPLLDIVEGRDEIDWFALAAQVFQSWVACKVLPVGICLAVACKLQAIP